MKYQNYDISLHTSKVGDVRFTNRHYNPHAPKVVLPHEHSINYFQMTHCVKSPTKRLISRVMNKLADMREEHLAHHPTVMLDVLASTESQVIALTECQKWVNSDLSPKSFMVDVKGKMLWRTAVESADIIPGFNSAAHEYCASKFDNITDISENEVYMNDCMESMALHQRFISTRKSLKHDIMVWEEILRQIDATVLECVSHL